MDVQTYMPHLPADERKWMLRENAVKIEQGSYYKPLAEDEKAANKDKLSENMQSVEDLEEQKKAFMDELNANLKSIKTANKSLLYQLRTGQKQCTGEQYMIPDHESGMMHIYDEDGELISSRRLRPDERQARIFPISAKPAAANDR